MILYMLSGAILINNALEELEKKMDKKLREDKKTIKLLFIGNSATYVHDIPQTLASLAGKAGYPVEANAIAKGGYTISQHADSGSDHGKAVLDEIAKGYDIVFLQDNGNCISSEDMRSASKAACGTLNAAIRAAGAETFIYIRPPYGKDSFGCTPFEQCVEFDKLFLEISKQLGTGNVYVNRAFAYAMNHLPYDLWGPDHAHISEYGAYLAVCVFFSSLFHVSSTVLDPNGLPLQDARALQQAADKIVLDGHTFPECMK